MNNLYTELCGTFLQFLLADKFVPCTLPVPMTDCPYSYVLLTLKLPQVINM